MSIHHPLYLLLAAIPALFNVGILLYLFFFVPRGRTTNTFSFFLLALIMWQTEDTVMRLIDTETQARYVDRLLCLGWQGFAPLVFHFACRYSRLKLIDKAYALVAVYLPFVVLHLIYIASADHTVFTLRGVWGWLNTPRPGEIDAVQRLVITIYTVAAVFILFRHAVTLPKGSPKKIQAFIIAAGIVIPALQGFVTQVMFPVMLHVPEIPVTSAFMTFFSLATVISIRAYGLFNISEAVELESVLQKLTSIVFVVSPRQKIIYINEWAKQVFNRPGGMQDGFDLELVFASTSYLDDFRQKVFERCFRGEAVSHFTTCLRDANGNTLHVVLSAELIRRSGKAQGMLVVANDVTQLQKTIKDLEQSNSQLEQYAHAASHDLQEPMRKITVFLSRLEELYKDRPGDPAADYLRKAISSATHMRQLINDLLQVAYVVTETGKHEVADMNEIMRTVITNLADEIHTNGAVIEAGALPVLSGCNKVLMQQLLSNLASNALKYRSDRQPQIRIAAVDKGDTWQFAVSDNGIGIAKEYHSEVFGFFKRLHSRQAYPGTGIGLSICKKIVEQHGGQIWVESEKDVGSTFYFTLPKNSTLTPVT